MLLNSISLLTLANKLTFIPVFLALARASWRMPLRCTVKSHENHVCATIFKPELHCWPHSLHPAPGSGRGIMWTRCRSFSSLYRRLNSQY
eukprot:2181609-Rhodomonas_salina.2